MLRFEAVPVLGSCGPGPGARVPSRSGRGRTQVVLGPGQDPGPVALLPGRAQALSAMSFAAM